jgi:lipopolysaccharide/colanic/teichoic acid biosynthesis glycosyltransferase
MVEIKYLAPEVVEDLKRNGPITPKPLFDKFTQLVDIAIAVIVLILAGPVMLLISLAIKLYDRGPVFFWQERLGKNGVPFKIIKFRSMVPNAANIGAKLRIVKDDQRITPIGRILRESHLDELPQLFNVLKGEMTLVGPRPALTFQRDYYEQWEMTRLCVTPGMTGLSQISGGNELNWDDRIIIDAYYVRHRNVLLYFKILLLTIVQLFYKQGVYTKESTVQGWTRPVPDWYRDNTTPLATMASHGD